MLDSASQQTAGEVAPTEQAHELQRRRRKRHRAERLKRFERLKTKALIAFLYVLTIFLVLAAWYGLLKT